MHNRDENAKAVRQIVILWLVLATAAAWVLVWAQAEGRFEQRPPATGWNVPPY